METIGQQLRNQRQKLHKSLDELHQTTKISEYQLELLEQDNFSFLPETYIKSFLKTYAEALDLNSSAILSQYRTLLEERRKQEQERHERLAEARAERASNRRLEWLLGLAAVALVLGLLFLYLTYRNQLAQPAERPSGHAPTRGESAEHPGAIQLASVDHGSLDLEITALKEVRLRVTIDGAPERAETYVLSPGSRMHLDAQQRYEIILADPSAVRLKLQDRELQRLGVPGVPLRVVLTTEGLVEKQIARF